MSENTPPNTHDGGAGDNINDSGLPESASPNIQQGRQDDGFDDSDLPDQDSSAANQPPPLDPLLLHSALSALNLQSQENLGRQSPQPALPSQFPSTSFSAQETEIEEQPNTGESRELYSSNDTTLVDSEDSFRTYVSADEETQTDLPEHEQPSEEHPNPAPLGPENFPLPPSSPPALSSSSTAPSPTPNPATSSAFMFTNNDDATVPTPESNARMFQNLVNVFTQIRRDGPEVLPVPSSQAPPAIPSESTPPLPSIPVPLPAPAQTKHSEATSAPIWRPKGGRFGKNETRCPMCVLKKRKRACVGGPPCGECKRLGYSAEECQGWSGEGIRKGSIKDRKRDSDLGGTRKGGEGFGGADFAGKIGEVV